MNKRVSPEVQIQWLDSLRRGDERAFAAIYDYFWSRLFSVAYNYTRSRETAQEMVQEVFISLWLHRQELHLQGTLQGYLTGAIRNKVYDYFDKENVRRRYETYVVQQASPESNSTEQQVHFAELSTLVDQQVSNLPETTRRIFRLSRQDGLSNSEISRQTQLSVKSVEYHLTKALKHLRLRLAQLLCLIMTGWPDLW
jgi:RNA polymerase sigma-70 factor (family 1)